MTSVQESSPTHLRDAIARHYDASTYADNIAVCGTVVGERSLTWRIPLVTCADCLVNLSTVILNRYAYLAVHQLVE